MYLLLKELNLIDKNDETVFIDKEENRIMKYDDLK